jgi:hypothetical protein
MTSTAPINARHRRFLDRGQRSDLILLVPSWLRHTPTILV